MKINLAKRKQAEKLIYDTFSALDPSGDNTKHYRGMFSSMSNKEFEDFFKELFDDDILYLILHVIDYDRDLSIENIEKAAGILNVPLEEYVILPHLNMDKDNPIVTLTPMITGYIVQKRMQQTGRKKNSTSTKTAERSPTTGQVTGDDKNARSSDQENLALVALGADNTLAEFLGPRSDGLDRKNQMYSDIAKTGSCSLANLDAGIDDRIVLNTIDVFFLGMGIKTDLVSEELMLPYTAKKM